MSNRGPLERQCTATSKRTGQRCGNAAMTGRTTCRHHGGKTPRGIASPHWKTGRYSKSLPGRLAAGFEEARTDPARLSLQEDIAVSTVAIEDLIRQLETARDADLIALWDAIAKQLATRQKLVSAEVKHMVLAGQVLTKDEAAAFVAALSDAIRQHTTEAQQAAIAEEFAAVWDR